MVIVHCIDLMIYLLTDGALCCICW